MNKRATKALADFLEALNPGTEPGDISDAFKAFVKGTPAEQNAAAAIAGNLAVTVTLAKTGQASKADVLFAIEQAKLGAIALAEAKVIRLKKAALTVFFDAVTLFLHRVLA